MGLDVDLHRRVGNTYHCVEERDSEKFPKHLFRIGYFRSSYSRAGINSVLSEQGVPDLHWIFGDTCDWYAHPCWSTALSRVREVLASYREATKDGRLSVTTVRAKGGNVQAGGAVELVKSRMANPTTTFRSYSDISGVHWADGHEVVAAIHGEDLWGDPAVHLVHRIPPSDEPDSYDKSLQIVEETIEWVLSQESPEEYALHWCG